METIRLQFGSLPITPAVVDRLHELDFTTEEPQDAIEDHKSGLDGEPSLYVGTYGKYNDGSLCGLWIDLTSFDDYNEFINFCRAIHSDEEDPELMAQDYENFPRQWYHEGFMSREDFDNIQEYWELCEKHGQDAVDDYMELFDDLGDFEDAYLGHFDDEEDYARHYIDECYNLERSMGSLARFFDYEAFARELFMYDFSMGSNNNVFRRV